MTPFISLGSRIKEVRMSLNLTQAQLADMCFTTQQCIHSLETDKVKRTMCIIRLAIALRVSPIWLRTGKEPRTCACVMEAIK